MCLRMIYNHLRLAVVGSLCALRKESTNLRNALFRLIDQDAPESVKEVSTHSNIKNNLKRSISSQPCWILYLEAFSSFR